MTKMLQLGGRTMATGLRFPEGPVAMPDGSVVLVEIERRTLTRVDRHGKVEVIANLGGGPNGAALGPDGKMYVCNNGGFDWHTSPDGMIRPSGRASDYSGGRIERVDLATGKVEILYRECNGVTLKGPNDIVFDAHGGFWFSDLGKIYGRQQDRGAVYYARADGSLIKEAVFPIFMPNGVGLSPDERTLYVAETETSRLWCFPIVGEGELQKEPFPSPHGGKFLAGPIGYQRFDSMAVEANGNVCVATLVKGGVSVISPTGELLEYHQGPEGYCTNIAFGGKNMQTAYVTFSGYGTLIEAPWPRPGLKLNHQSL